MMRNAKMRTWAVGIVAVITLAAGIITWYATGYRESSPAAGVAKAPALKTEAADPITIPAIRALKYSASPLSVVKDEGDKGGYHDTIISYQSDGLAVRALKSTPDGTAPPGGWPVIILAHGYINPADYQTDGPEYRPFIAAFTAAGYMVVKPDYRGHGQSQGVAEGGHFSPAYTYDVMNLIASLKQDKEVNPGRIGLFGHSLGGHTVLRTAVVSPDVKATVIMSGVVGSIYDILYNWPHSPMPNDQPKAVVSGHREELLKKYGDPKQNPDFWNSASAINYVGSIAGSVQIDVGGNDEVVPVSFSQALRDKLQAAGKSTEYNLFPGDDHQLSRNRAAALQKMTEFYKAHL